MKPILFTFVGMEFPSYTLMVMVGIASSTFVGYQIAKRRGMSLVAILDLAILGILFGFLGARLAHVLVENPLRYWEDPKLIFYFWEGGFVSWGAHLAIFFSWIVYLRLRRLPVWLYLDVAAHVLLLTMIFGRLGCFLNGCCFGKPAAFGWGFHPTQLYHMAHVLAVQGILWWVARKRWTFQGQLMALAFILYAPGRFFIEFFRGDADRGLWFDGLFSSAQLAMFFYFAFGIAMFLALKRKCLSPNGRGVPS